MVNILVYFDVKCCINFQLFLWHISFQAKQLAQVRLVSFSRHYELAEAIQYIKDNVYITREGGQAKVNIFTCGVGCSQYKKTLEDELQCW